MKKCKKYSSFNSSRNHNIILPRLQLEQHIKPLDVYYCNRHPKSTDNNEINLGWDFRFQYTLNDFFFLKDLTNVRINLKINSKCLKYLQTNN